MVKNALAYYRKSVNYRQKSFIKPARSLPYIISSNFSFNYNKQGVNIRKRFCFAMENKLKLLYIILIKPVGFRISCSTWVSSTLDFKYKTWLKIICHGQTL
jgi:hypothetical protein